MSHFTDLLVMSFSLSLHFLPVLSLQTSVCSTLKFYPVFCGHNEYKIIFFYFYILLIFKTLCFGVIYVRSEKGDLKNFLNFPIEVSKSQFKVHSKVSCFTLKLPITDLTFCSYQFDQLLFPSWDYSWATKFFFTIAPPPRTKFWRISHFFHKGDPRVDHC